MLSTVTLKFNIILKLNIENWKHCFFHIHRRMANNNIKSALKLKIENWRFSDYDISWLLISIKIVLLLFKLNIKNWRMFRVEIVYSIFHLWNSKHWKLKTEEFLSTLLLYIFIFIHSQKYIKNNKFKI